MLGQHASAQLVTCLALGRMPLVQVNTIVDHVHALGINRRVAAQNIVAHAVGDGDNSAGSLVSGLLHVGGQAVAAAELLGLPGAQGLEGMGGDDVWDVAEERGDVACEVGVPGVGVHQVRPLTRGGNLKVNAEGTQRCVGTLQLGQVRMASHPRIGSVGSGFTRAIEGLHSQIIDEAAQHLGQLENMDTGSAVDVGRVFAGEQINAHDVVLPTVATRVTHSIRNHGDRNRNETV